MADHVPFVFNTDDCKLTNEFYSDSPFVRLPLGRAQALSAKLAPSMAKWVDAEVDGFDSALGSSQPNEKWVQQISKFTNHQHLRDSAFIAKPDKAKVRDFCYDVLDACQAQGSSYVSVPQLPMTKDNSRNKINRALAEAAGHWKAKSSHGVKLVLPVVLTHQEQVNQKTARNPKIKLIGECFQASNAQVTWVVDADLYDQQCTSTFQAKRFPGLLAFHEELRSKLGGEVPVVAGPYWGINLVLWARGLCDFPAVGVGHGYRYYVPGGMAVKASVRIALPPLRRLAKMGSGLQQWLDQAVKKVSNELPAHAEFAELRKNYAHLTVEAIARRQIARFYKEWYELIAGTDKKGRALALYQDLSLAFVLGKQSLPAIPTEDGPARHPERVAQYLMLNCL